MATILIVAVIVHGSLYPYDFHARPGGVGAVETFLGSWADRPAGLPDLAANILLYMPLGLFGALALRGPAALRIALTTLAGAALCTGMELLQFYDAGRVTSMSDAYTNTAGTLIGALAALLLGAKTRLPAWRLVAANPVPAMLLGAMLGYRLFPYVPTTDLHKYWRALQPVLFGPDISPGLLLRYFALWLTAGALLEGVFGARWSRLILPLLVGFVLAGKVIIVDSVVTRPELAGAAAGIVTWSVLTLLPRGRAAIGAIALLGLILAQRLLPFEWQPVPHAFGWLPFRSFMGGSLAVNTASFLEKVFLYGSLIWLLRQQVSALAAAGFTAALLFLASYAQTYLPGRSGEITDAVMALLIAGLIALLEAHGRDAPAGAREAALFR